MADPYIGEIRIFPFTFAPEGWALCNGQVMPIQQNSALFSILGTTYGGDGQTSFKLPNLMGSAPLGVGAGPNLTPRALGDTGGAASVTLTALQLPPHGHNVAAVSGDTASTAVGTPGPTTFFGQSQAKAKTTGYVVNGTPPETLNASVVLPSGDSLPHNNLPPYVTFNFCIATTGVWPARP